jgi:hypothetical protein
VTAAGGAVGLRYDAGNARTRHGDAKARNRKIAGSEK